MNGTPYARLGLAYRPKPKKTSSAVTAVAFACVACTVIILFWQGHSSVMRMHTAMQSPTTEQPAGWATLHKTTTVQSATVTISGSEITGSALTATTTELRAAGTAAEAASTQQAASQAAATAVAAAAAAHNSSSFSGSLTHMLGDLQHSLHAMLTAHAGWKPGAKITRAQLAAAAAASMPDEDRDIELHAHKVAQVVGGAKVAEQLQRLAQGGPAATTALANGDELTSAEAFAGLYGAGGGTVSFTAATDLTKCPPGSPSPGSAQTALILLGGSSTAALKRSLDGLLLLYSRASPDVRSAFHLYVALDSSSSEEIRAVAMNYVHDTMGAVKLVLQADSAGSRSSSTSRSGTSSSDSIRASEHAKAKGRRPDLATVKAGTPAGGSATAGSKSQTASAGRRLLAAAGPAAAAGASTFSRDKQPGDQHRLLKQPKQAIGKQQQPNQARQQQVRAANTAARTNSKPAPTAPVTTGSTSSSTTPGPAHRSSTNHLQLMLHVFFPCFKYPSVLLLQDDLKLAPDFLDFFYSSYWLLGSDPSLYCLSAWNPQGHRQQAVHPTRIVRTDYHPGKAWLIKRDLGLHLVTNTPNWQEPKLEAAGGLGGKNGGNASHDGLVQLLQGDGMRRGRQCLIPEMPRVVPAGVDETFEGAHIHSPKANGIIGKDHVLLSAADYTVGISKESSSSHSSSTSSQEGAVDMEAYADYDTPEEDFAIDSLGDTSADDGISILQLKHGLSPDAGDTGAHQQQQGGTAGCGITGCRSWLHKDLSVLLAGKYEAYMHQALSGAKGCDVATAAKMTDTHAACVITYNSAAYLAAAAHRLGIPLGIPHGIKYCYDLPQAGAANSGQQHCQDYLPEMAYKGIVSGYNHHSVRIFLAHVRYVQALTQSNHAVGAAPAPSTAKAWSTAPKVEPAAAPNKIMNTATKQTAGSQQPSTAQHNVGTSQGTKQ